MLSFLKLNNKNTNKADWSFQEDAIKNIVKDFKNKPTGRYLLVIPTGGGKTLTAIRAINELVNQGFFKKGERTLWTVHSRQLFAQASKAIIKPENIRKFSFRKDLIDFIDVKMKEEARKIL